MTKRSEFSIAIAEQQKNEVSYETMKKESNLFFSEDTKMKYTTIWNKMLECLPFYVIHSLHTLPLEIEMHFYFITILGVSRKQ